MSQSHPKDRSPVYCERCATRLVPRATNGHTRPVCPGCGRVAYLDPKVAAGAIVRVDGGIVLVRRGIEPSMGKWVFPGGYVDRGEPTEAAAAREVREECGLEVAVGELVGAFSYVGVPVVLLVYEAEVTGGVLSDGDDEVLEVATFAPEEIPWDDLGFDSTRDALRSWLGKKDE